MSRGAGLWALPRILAAALCVMLVSQAGPSGRRWQRAAVPLVVPRGTCRLEMMGLPDAQAYRRRARDLLKGKEIFSGFNIPNKKPGEPLLEWAAALLEELPGSNVCVHYSLKHQSRGDPAGAFKRFCADAAGIGVSSVMLVSGPKGPKFDAVAMLEELRDRHPAPGRLKLGVAFNACLPQEAARRRERGRLERKLRTGLVDHVYLNTGDDCSLLAEGCAFVVATAADLRQRVELLGSALMPNFAQLQQFRDRPWNGVSFSERYLQSLEGMEECTREILATFRREGVEPIVESKVMLDEHVRYLGELLRGADRASAADKDRTSASDEAAVAASVADKAATAADGAPSRQGLLEALGLKDVPRTGWVREGVRSPESVAAHSWGVAFLASQLCPDSLDRGRVLEMSILHDLAEVRVGDITPDDMVSKEEKHAMEADAIRSMQVTERSRSLFMEYEAQQTDEARFVKLMDKLDMALQAERYEGAQGLELAKFKEAARELAREQGLGHLVAGAAAERGGGA